MDYKNPIEDLVLDVDLDFFTTIISILTSALLSVYSMIINSILNKCTIKSYQTVSIHNNNSFWSFPDDI